jgi:PhoPQ-activated pathogenicity-related protein
VDGRGGTPMNVKRFLVITIALLLIGCTNTNESKEDPVGEKTADTPEEAVEIISDKEKTFTIYGTYQANDHLALVVFKGYMNKRDIWVAQVTKENDQWITENLVLMEEPKSGQKQTIYSDSDLGYEVGYLKGDSSDFEAEENTKVINLEADSQWKIWLKYLGTTISS